MRKVRAQNSPRIALYIPSFSFNELLLEHILSARLIACLSIVFDPIPRLMDVTVTALPCKKLFIQQTNTPRRALCILGVTSCIILFTVRFTFMV